MRVFVIFLTVLLVALGGPQGEMPSPDSSSKTSENQSSHAQASDEVMALLARQPHSLRQAYLRMFEDAIEFAFLGDAWSLNLQVAILWRMNLADIHEECIPNTRNDCLQSKLLDRELVLDVFRKALPLDASEWDSVGDVTREMVVARTVDLMAHLLKPNINDRYQVAEVADGRGPNTPPEIAYGMVASIGMELRRSHALEPIQGYAANIAFAVLSQPGDDLEALPILFVDRELPVLIKGQIPSTLSAVSLDEVFEYLAHEASQSRVTAILVPEGKVGGTSVYLTELADRAIILLNDGQIDQGLALIEKILNESESSELNEYLTDIQKRAAVYGEN